MIDHTMKRLNLQPDYYISNAGTYILNRNQEIIYAAHIAQSTLTRLLDYLKAITLKSVIFADCESEYYLFTNVETEVVNEMPRRKVLNQDFDSLYHQEIACFKIIDEPVVLEKIIADLIAMFGDDLTLVVNTDSSLLEIHPKNSSKGHAIKHLQKLLKIPDDQVIVAGDDDNDLTMLDSFDNSFCIRQPYNGRIQSHGHYLIDHLYEIKNYLK
jgi:hypothetical protein